MCVCVCVCVCVPVCLSVCGHVCAWARTSRCVCVYACVRERGGRRGRECMLIFVLCGRCIDTYASFASTQHSTSKPPSSSFKIQHPYIRHGYPLLYMYTSNTLTQNSTVLYMYTSNTLTKNSTRKSRLCTRAHALRPRLILRLCRTTRSAPISCYGSGPVKSHTV